MFIVNANEKHCISSTDECVFAFAKIKMHGKETTN